MSLVAGHGPLSPRRAGWFSAPVPDNYKGWASSWVAVIGETVVDDVAWSHDAPLPAGALDEGK